jgi:hypothetical protein
VPVAVALGVVGVFVLPLNAFAFSVKLPATSVPPDVMTGSAGVGSAPFSRRP